MRQQDKIIANLVALGGQIARVQSSRKYVRVTFETPVVAQIGKATLNLAGEFWVGKCGALRRGRTASESLAVTDAFRYLVLSAESK